MNYAEFQTARELLLHEHPNLCDCGKTNLYRALARLAPPATPEPAPQVHRCHLAGEWCDRFGFPPEASRRALISSGVRDSLARLFRHCSETNSLVWLPSDNYPVYGDLARHAGCEIKTFPTLPNPQWPDAAPAARDEVLLVTNPLKPLGRCVNDRDVRAMQSWLATSPRRRLWLDAVYTFDTRFDPATQRLLAAGRTILLHSLTKGWLQPRCYGVALVPECDAPALTPFFRKDPPPQSNLARARECLRIYAATPAAVAEALEAARRKMLRHLSSANISGLSTRESAAPGYFLIAATNWRRLLDSRNILGIPATAFGSAREDLTILSTLSFAQ